MYHQLNYWKYLQDKYCLIRLPHGLEKCQHLYLLLDQILEQAIICMMVKK